MKNPPKVNDRYLNAYERMIGPFWGTLIPFACVMILMVVTAVQSQRREIIPIDIPRPVEDDPPPEQKPEDDPPEPPEPIEQQVDFQIDTPATTFNETEFVNSEPVITSEPVSMKPADRDAVSIIKCPVTMPSISGSRTPGARGRFLTGGPTVGDSATEHSVMMALRWLKKTQRTDGSWNGQPISNTALALLCYLAHGETPRSEEFGATVETALEYLIGAMQEGADGKVRFKGSDGNEYAFLIATYALAEAYGMTKHPDAKYAAEKGLERILRGQSPTGGWDYKLNCESTRDDMSYAGWALQALKACKLAGLHPNGLDDCIKKAMHCLAKRNFSNGGFNYTAGGSPTGLTATGCLAMQLLGFSDRCEVAASLDTMREWLPTFSKDELKIGGASAGVCPQYYCYYATQCKYQSGMCAGAEKKNLESWAKWNAAMKKLYTSTIIVPEEKIEGPDGREFDIGYWKNTDAHGAGDTMSTCLCALQLMVYYRYLPTTKVSSRHHLAQR